MRKDNFGIMNIEGIPFRRFGRLGRLQHRLQHVEVPASEMPQGFYRRTGKYIFKLNCFFKIRSIQELLLCHRKLFVARVTFLLQDLLPVLGHDFFPEVHTCEVPQESPLVFLGPPAHQTVEFSPIAFAGRLAQQKQFFHFWTSRCRRMEH